MKTKSQSVQDVSRRGVMKGGLGAASLAALGGAAAIFPASARAQTAIVTADEAKEIAKNAYIFCYPLNYYMIDGHLQGD
jgi:hypothetical protein